MSIRVNFFFCIFASLVFSGAARKHVRFNRYHFPTDFIFGTSSSAYQVEGAVSEDGRGLSIWDTFTRQHPEKIEDGSNGDAAINSYHLYKEDVKIMSNMNVDAYRFSIAWSRVIPTGRIKDGVNKLGVQYYNNLINLLLSKGIQPYVTIFHWDVPQAIEDDYLGFLSERIINDFLDFANLCFKEFGHRVKHWITLNEPHTFSDMGYNYGLTAPGRCSSSVGNCTVGDSSREPYLVAHNLLLSHAAAVKLYREKYQKSQNGKIGITNSCHWMVPLTKSKADKAAAGRALDFMYGWFLDPIVHGDYPKSMRSLVGNRLPKFTKEQSAMVNGSYDFVGINYYTAYYASNVDNSNSSASYLTDPKVNQTMEKNGVLIGSEAGSSWLHVYPSGIRDVLLYTKKIYNNPVIYITENGISETNNNTLSLKEALKDDMRIDYYRRHLSFLRKSIKEGVRVKGYFGWSLCDSFEWISGFTVRFGINYVDYENGFKRHHKNSSLWFKKFLAK